MKKVFFLFFLVLLGCIFFLSSNLEKKRSDIYIEDMLYLPSGNFLKGAALGYDEMVSDLLWIKALGYFGGHATSDQDYSWLSHLLDIITTLDPSYQYPYEFGGIVLSTEVGDVEKSTALLEKGMKNVDPSHSRYWYFPFFIAFNYMYHKNDYQTAARYLEKASKFPQSPEYIPLLVSRLYANSDSPEVAIAFLEEMIKGTEKQELKTKLIQRLHQVIHANNIKFLERALSIFIKKLHRYPENIKELVDERIIPYIPVDPRGGTYYISPKDHSIRNTIKAEELKVHIENPKKTILNMVPTD